jgi:hypothetical protein
LSTKDRKILDLEKALAEQDDASKKNISDLLEKLKLLFGEYQKSLNEFGVRPAPLPADLGFSDFLEWMDQSLKRSPRLSPAQAISRQPSLSRVF